MNLFNRRIFIFMVRIIFSIFWYEVNSKSNTNIFKKLNKRLITNNEAFVELRNSLRRDFEVETEHEIMKISHLRCSFLRAAKLCSARRI